MVFVTSRGRCVIWGEGPGLTRSSGREYGLTLLLSAASLFLCAASVHFSLLFFSVRCRMSRRTRERLQLAGIFLFIILASSVFIIWVHCASKDENALKMKDDPMFEYYVFPCDGGAFHFQ